MAGLLLATGVSAQVQNGGFTDGADKLDNWEMHGYRRSQHGTAANPLIPKKFEDLGLANMDTGSFVTKSAVIEGPSSVVNTGNALAWPAGKNALRVHDDVMANGDSNRTSSVQQSFTIVAGDIDTNPVHGKDRVHLRFLGAPVLDKSSHTGETLPFYFIDIVKISGAQETVIYTDYNYANQAGIVWQISGDYAYTDWVEYDIPLKASDVAVGDELQFRITAAGCAAGGHAGAFYVRDVRTGIYSGMDKSLWVTAEGPDYVQETEPGEDWSTITYTYTYTNNGNDPISNVMVEPGLPVTSNIRDLNDKHRTEFVSITNPSFGTGTPTCTAPSGAAPGSIDTPWQASCNIGTLQPGETGYFTMTVKVPPATKADTVNNGYYPISGTDVDHITGQMIKTPLVAKMVPDVTNVPKSMPFGQPLPATASYSCTNMGATEAVGATCSISGLPAGVTAGQCKLNGVDWNNGDDVGIGQTVICPLSGTPNDPALNKPGATVNISVTADTTNGVGGAGGSPMNTPVAGAGSGGGVAVGPLTPASIPTLSEWGLIIMSGLMALFTLGMRRRQML